ncbi:ISAzo13-like element transposase-related protein [Streptomyces sp. H27-H5]|uniref:ISAzo13-like element transposase-related protein n=1 Tax=Streptomyces sp. H27-H5 TaxID=2996460 RepID=UPI003B640DAC
MTGAGAGIDGSLRPAGEPVPVGTHDFQDRQGLARRSHTGSMTSPRTPAGSASAPITTPAAFAVASTCRSWRPRGGPDGPAAARLLITADAGGSNGYRIRAWKTELALLAAETGSDITVCIVGYATCSPHHPATGHPMPLFEYSSSLWVTGEQWVAGPAVHPWGWSIRASGWV